MSQRLLGKTTLLAALLVAVPAFAADAGNGKSSGTVHPSAGAMTGQAPVTTATVLSTLHATNLVEESAGELATRQGRTPDVRAFGKVLELDHAKADKQVMALAAKKSVNLTNQTDGAKLKEGQATLDLLKSTPPSRFDAAFTAAMVGGHRDAIQFAKDAVDHVQDADVKKLLQDQLPVLERHLQTAAKLRARALAH